VPGSSGTHDVPLIPLVLKESPARHSNNTNCSGFLTGKVLSNTASTTLNNAVFAPIPSASESTAIAVTLFCFSNIRAP